MAEINGAAIRFTIIDGRVNMDLVPLGDLKDDKGELSYAYIAIQILKNEPEIVEKYMKILNDEAVDFMLKSGGVGSMSKTIN